MSYDFPASPAEGQDYTPPAGGQTYTWVSPHWIVKGIPPAGSGGPPGPAGPQGPKGDTGTTGAQGPKGDTGTAGTTGAQGPPGTTGATGLQGPPGTAGAPGATGSTGPAGSTGPQGPKGDTGSAGAAGADGATGAPGVQGPKGDTGAQGPAGSPDTPAQVLGKLVTVDGAGSTLDADLLDGQEGAWYRDWANLTSKPTTFPPTLPIASSGVTGLDLKQAAQDTAIGTKLDASAYTAADVLAKIKTVDGPGSNLDADFLDGQDSTYYSSYANLTGKPATFPPTLPIPWTDVSGKPATYPPTLPIAQSGVTNLTTDLAGKAPTVHTHAESDVTGLVADLAAKEPTITGGTVGQYWRGDKSWQTLPAAGATVSDTAPGSPTQGMMWFDSTTASLLIYYTDADSSQWVQIGGTSG